MNHNGSGVDEQPLDASAMAALMQTQQRDVTRRDLRASAVIVATWGVVWLVGYLLVWSSDAVDANPWFRLPDSLTGAVFAALVAAGIVISTVTGISMGRGHRGPSNRAAAMFGVSFAVGSLAFFLFDMGMLRAGLTGDQLSLLFPASFTLLIGALYMAGAGITRSRAQYVAGVLLLAVVAAATFIGVPHHLLVYSAAGLIFLVSAWLLWTGRIDA